MALDEFALEPSQVGGVMVEAIVAFALNVRVFEELAVRSGVRGTRV
eukprot:CAMPEP_0181090528 /NCGR_PEP_ID=MMETSP1071-20121207/7906_1 /TAXON_ID=35127 /ORGANISM="Thalassiosira sp., Strain NH16" /LENGTH=45 /DNA_ID= /DNA_START= /DNA_END= /DNA_ORIENTATION=